MESRCCLMHRLKKAVRASVVLLSLLFYVFGLHVHYVNRTVTAIGALKDSEPEMQQQALHYIMSGEMSMAPIITAVEFTLRPSEAMNIANTSTHSRAPRNDTSALMARMVAASSALSGIASKNLSISARDACHSLLASIAICSP